MASSICSFEIFPKLFESCITCHATNTFTGSSLGVLRLLISQLRIDSLTSLISSIVGSGVPQKDLNCCEYVCVKIEKTTMILIIAIAFYFKSNTFCELK